jgi:TPR repeat protein
MVASMLHAARTTIAAFLITLALVGTAWAGSLEDATAAYVRGDYATALRLYRPLANQGTSAAQFWLGVMYDKGDGVPQDYVQAAKWYRLAAEKAYPEAQYQLALLYLSGRGGPQNYPEALILLRIAAEHGFEPAQFMLWLYLHGGRDLYCPGFPQDYVEAMKWLRKAADQGDSNARSNLGFMYRDGEGVPQDFVQAHMWFNLAVAAAKPDERNAFVVYRDAVAVRMTPAQIAEAQKLAREWAAAHPVK